MHEFDLSASALEGNNVYLYHFGFWPSQLFTRISPTPGDLTRTQFETKLPSEKNPQVSLTVSLDDLPSTLREVFGSNRANLVTDTGVGISEAFVDGLFEPFSQEDHRVNRKFEGSGLGMAIAAGLVKAMEGRIEVESEQGVGSTFTVALPLVREA